MKKLKWLALFILAVTAVVIFFHWQNNDIVTTNIKFRSNEVPEGFRGYRIVQVSDLHNKEFGQNNGELLARIEAEQPDIIVITGDLVDSRKPNVSVAVKFVEAAVKIAPVYYVSGNHEEALNYEDIRSRLIGAGATVLDDASIILERGGDQLALLGLADPDFIEYEYDHLRDDSYFFFSEALETIIADHKDELTILLSHRPEKMSLYTYHEVDLVFSGHAHGGQFRLPFIGGLVAPEQGFFPEYDSGLYREGGTAMVVSRGLGNSIIPLRVFNRPELVVVTLMGE